MKNWFSAYHLFESFINTRFRKAGLFHHEFKSDRFCIEYWDSKSEKSALLLLPAFAPEAKYSWFKQIKILSVNHRLIIPNLIYFGKSTMYSKSYELKDQVLALQELLVYLKINELSIIGASYGGLIAIEIAHLNEFRIQRLVLANPKIFLSSDQDVMIDLAGDGKIDRMDLLVPDSPYNLKRLFNHTYHRKLPVPMFVFNNLHKYLYSKNVYEKRELVRACVAGKTSFSLNNMCMNFPVLIIYGANDKLVSIDQVNELQKMIGHSARVEIIKRTAHMPNYERPRHYNKILIAFLKGN